MFRSATILSPIQHTQVNDDCDTAEWFRYTMTNEVQLSTANRHETFKRKVSWAFIDCSGWIIIRRLQNWRGKIYSWYTRGTGLVKPLHRGRLTNRKRFSRITSEQSRRVKVRDLPDPLSEISLSLSLSLSFSVTHHFGFLMSISICDVVRTLTLRNP